MIPADRIQFPAALWKKYITSRSDIDRNALVVFYFSLVDRVVRKVAAKLPPHIDPDDLISHGSLGLIDAIGKADPRRPERFAGFAIRRIFGAIMDGLRETDVASRVARKRSTKLHAAQLTFYAEHGRPPTDSELSERTKLTSRQLAKMRWMMLPLKMRSIDGAASSRDVQLIDTSACTRESDPALNIETQDAAAALLARCKARAGLFSRLYFLGYSAKYIASAFGVCEATVFTDLRNARTAMQATAGRLCA